MENRPKKGKYSRYRTARGNVQIGRLDKKSNLKIVKNMQSIVNLNKGRPKRAEKFVASGRLALRRERKRL